MTDKIPLLKVRNLRTYFYTSHGAVRAVDGASLDVHRGEIVGLVGESGSGKSALGMSVSRLVPLPGRIVEGSSIQFKGKELLALSDEEMRTIRGKEIGMVFQDPMTHLNPLMRIANQVAETLVVHKKLRLAEARKEAVRILELVKLRDADSVARCYPHQLSGGMRQRALIAIAIACSPSLVIADEPTTALDALVQRQVLELVRELKDMMGISFLFISHDVGMVSSLCDRVYVMYAGKVVEGADTKALFTSPKHPYTGALMSAAESIHGGSLMAIEGEIPDLANPPKGCRFHTRCPAVHLKCTQHEPVMERHEDGHEFACWRPIARG